MATLMDQFEQLLAEEEARKDPKKHLTKEQTQIYELEASNARLKKQLANQKKKTEKAERERDEALSKLEKACKLMKQFQIRS